MEEMQVIVLGFTFLLAVSLKYPVFGLRGIMRGKVGSACEEFEDKEGRILGKCV